MSATISNGVRCDERPVFFFDIDDCLYPKSLGVAEMMRERLVTFVTKNLSLSEEQAMELCMKYYQEHTMTVVGLEKFHQIDPMVFNDQNDNDLPMDSLLSPDPALRAVLQNFDSAKVKLWLFTNAHITHGLRVVKLLGIDDLFEGITYCDYSDGLWHLKPRSETFAKAEAESGAAAPEQCYFVDDSPRNCDAALARGWQVVRISDLEVSDQDSAAASYPEITQLSELHDIFPQFRKSELESKASHRIGDTRSQLKHRSGP